MRTLLASLQKGIKQFGMRTLLASLQKGMKQFGMRTLLASLQKGMKQSGMRTLQACHARTWPCGNCAQHARVECDAPDERLSAFLRTARRAPPRK